MASLLFSLYAAAVLALLVTAVSILRLYCENFGCIGVGIAWFAWCISFAVVLGVGLLARNKTASVPGLARACRFTWWLQLVLGTGLVALWIARNVV